MRRIILNLSAFAMLCFIASPVAAIELDVSQITAINFSTGNNPVSVTTAATTTAAVTSDVGCQVDFSIAMNSGVLTFEPSDSEQQCPVLLVVPENFASLKIESSNGSITFTGNLKNLEIAGDNGTATVTNSSFDSLVVSNTNGAVLLDTVSANRTNLKSVNAGVTVAKLSSPFSVEATNGKLRMSKITVPNGSRNSIRKTNGNVLVNGIKVIPPLRERKARVTLTTKTVNGDVKVANKALFNRRRSLTSSLGTGRVRARLSISTINADITVR